MSCLEYVMSGNLDGLQQACDTDVKWNKWIPLAAVMFQHFDCLRFAVENGCPLDSQCIYASLDGDISILIYLVKAKCPGYKEIPRILSTCERDIVFYGKEQRDFFTTMFRENPRYHDTVFYSKIEKTFSMEFSKKELLWFTFVRICNKVKGQCDEVFDYLLVYFLCFFERHF